MLFRSRKANEEEEEEEEKNKEEETSLAVQWSGLCAPTAGGTGLIPGWGTRSHMLHGVTKNQPINPSINQTHLLVEKKSKMII